MNTKKEKAIDWLKKHEICGSQAWWDGKMYYSLSIEQILNIAKYIFKNEHNTTKTDYR